ncbi:hypothetical protein SCATT_p10750 (plasmid) [Streptantibioticus cattleyicolor NRRL 8057 = DSM 46488]|uniref:Uncharacterized protein n=1 Tax=Streptantibioticus cattleyicolor (strain ATCC 35852 / DSM 46488 / JCM 4925 / NBRC 14057 / NRRL 8057) TaxID=1003195 RepID=G8XEB4_STREN|nr:hypothetical protein SCATT_p10750 [Streptantibioticus cattleyicolor NRRL 8057 = DSM 46488]
MVAFPAQFHGELLSAVGPELGPTRCGQEIDARSARSAQLRADLTATHNMAFVENHGGRH